MVPNIRKRYSNDPTFCRVLATALLFGAMDEGIGPSFFPQVMRHRIRQAYTFTHPNIVQPVNRVPLKIYQIEDNLVIEKMGIDGLSSQLPVPRVTSLGRAHTSAFSADRQQSMSLPTSFGLQQQENNSRKAAPNADDGKPATLIKQPRTLAELWDEYQLGIGGRKPAKDWQPFERRNAKDGIRRKYYRRKFIWATMEKLMERGDTRDAAIRKIKRAYGFRCSIAEIIDSVIRDHKDGGTGHVQLVNLSPFLRRGRFVSD